MRAGRAAGLRGSISIHGHVPGDKVPGLLALFDLSQAGAVCIPRGHLVISGDILVVVTVGRKALLARDWVEPGDAATCPTTPRTAPQMSVVLRLGNPTIRSQAWA